jgi:hypothetical protein
MLGPRSVWRDRPALNLIEPPGLWEAVRAQLARPEAIALLVLIPIVGALAVASAAAIGVRVFNTEWNAVFGYSARADTARERFAALSAALALAPIAQGVVGALVLPLYSRPRKWRAALAVAVVGAVPLYVSGLAVILLPGIMLVLGGFFVSFVWWAKGARELLDVPQEECIEYVAATLVASSALLLLTSTAFPF